MQHREKKAIERRYAEAFISSHVECRSIEDSENPDFWIRRDDAADIGLEVTEYHPTSDEVEGLQRREIESRWRDSLEPLLDAVRRTRPELHCLQVSLQFKDPKLPKKKEHQELATELVNLVTIAAGSEAAQGPEINISFASRLETDQCNRFSTGWTFMPQEDWPHCSRHLSSVSIRKWGGVDWPPWTCFLAELAWVSPRSDEFNRILLAKVSKAQKYKLGECPLWLLVVVDLLGDSKSHLALSNEEDAKELLATVKRCGFDFQNSPFEQVWLLSALFRWSLKLYPTCTAS